MSSGAYLWTLVYETRLVPRAASVWRERETDQVVSALQRLQLLTRRDQRVEHRSRNGNAVDHTVDAADLGGEIPDEFAAGRMPREAPTVLQHDRDSRRKEWLIVGRNEVDAAHHLQHLRRIAVDLQ